MKKPQHKPRIALPVPTSADHAYNDRCWPEYAAAVEAVGGEPIRIPLELDPSDMAKVIAECSGVLLPGSPADVHPQKYGQTAEPETAPADFQREAADELLLQDAFHLRKPVLGVCFGMQMMNVWRGGSLVQHLSTGPHATGSDREKLTHVLAVQPEALLMRSFFLDRERPQVNSSHHQAVKYPGDGLIVAARSADDGVIEAVEGASPQEQFCLGVQWHPERSYMSDEPSHQIFVAFVAAAHRWHLPSQ